MTTITIVDVDPDNGSIAGGTPIIITGTGFTGVTSVEFGANPGTGLVVNPTLITVVTPQAFLGPNNASIYLLNGTTFVGSFFPFRYFNISPPYGLSGDTIEIEGGGLNSSITINELKIGGITIPSGDFSFDPPNSYPYGIITCNNIPVHAAGLVDIYIETNDGTSTEIFTYNSAFTYYNIPTIDGFSPIGGPVTGGTNVTITGTNFGLPGYPPPTVTFGGTDAPNIQGYTELQITVTSPANIAGIYTISVTNFAGGTADSLPDQYSYGPTPTISGISPLGGSVNGVDVVTIDGANFGTSPDPLPTVKFGTQDATGITRINNTQITAISPANTAGNYIIYASNLYGIGQSPIPYLYADPPTITSFDPLGGPATGGTPVTITGTNFGSVGFPSPTITFDGTGVSPSSYTDTQIIVNSPSHIADYATILVSSFSGAVISDPYLYADPPTITTFTPQLGPFSGGTLVTIDGANFGPTGFQMPTVKFGGTAATSIFRNSETRIIAASPPISQSSIPLNTIKDASIYISSFSGTGLSGTDFGYYKTPKITSIDPTDGPISGGIPLEIKGENFISISTVTIGGVSLGPTGFSYTNPSTINAITPPNTTGLKSVIVNNETLQSNTNVRYNYLPSVPEITDIDPAFGPTFGGETIIITGTNFTNVLSLIIGGYYPQSITVVDGTTITAITPAGNPGNQLVVLSTGNGSVSYPFEYISPIATVSPSYGPDAGGTPLTITGTYLVDVIDISINSTSIEFYYDPLLDTITIITPANTAGSVSIVLTWPNSIILYAIFTYTASPTIINVSPLSGIFLGGTSITITGTNFIDILGFPLTVTIGGNQVTPIDIDPITGIVTCNTPANTVGAKTLELTTAGGTAFATFTYIGPTITNVYPSRGPTIGGTFITITGTYFSTIQAGTIDGNPLTNITLTNNTVTALTPASTPQGTLGIKTLSLTMYGLPTISYYTYDNTPLITIVVPNGGTPNGGTTIQIIGTSFINPVTVTIGGVQCINPIADQSNTIITTITPPGLIGIRSLVVTTNGQTATSEFNYLLPLPTFPYGNRECAGPPYNATNFTIANKHEYDKLVNYAKNSPNYPFDTGVELQQIYKGQRNVIMFNSLNQKTDAVRNVNKDRISKGLLGNIPYPQFKSQTERIMYIQGQTLTAARNRMTGENPTIPMGVPCSTIYEIINS